MDNDSRDASAAVAEAAGARVLAHRTATLGFAGGCTAGAERHDGAAAVLLQPGLRGPEPGALEALRAVVRRAAPVGRVAGAR